MTTRLTIAPDFKLPTEAVTETFAIVGKRGSGKTNTAVVFVEELLKAKLPVCVIDPVGVWWGLRAGADGKSPGLPITIVGGDHGDVPLEEASGKTLAAFVVEEHAQLVLDLSTLRKGAQQRFMVDFAETLYRLKASRRVPLHLVIDEADAYAPQNFRGEKDGPGPRLLGAMEDLIRRGRSRGIGMTMITQRPAVLNKNLLTQAEVLIVMKMTSPQDQGAIDDWVKANAEDGQRAKVAASLPSLPIGTAWFWSPGWLNVFQQVKVRARHTFDSSATPKAGERTIVPRELAPVDLEALRKRMADSINRAAADDPTRLRALITKLEKDLAAANSAKAPPERVEVPIFGKEDRLRLDTVQEDLARIAKAFEELNATVNQIVAKTIVPQYWEGKLRPTGVGKAITTSIEMRQTNGAPNGHSPSTLYQTARRSDAPAPSADGKRLGKCEQALLRVLAARHPQPTTLAQLAILSGYSVKSSTFQNSIGRLRSLGLAEKGSPTCATPAGVEAAGTVPPLPSGRALVSHWISQLPQAEGRLLDTIVNAHPRELTKEKLGELSGYSVTSSSFQNAIGKLRTLELVKKGSTSLGPALAEALS